MSMKKHEMFPNLFCEMCLTDDEVVCKRDKDVKCIHCGMELCGYHMGKHLKECHFVDLEWMGIS